MASKRSRDDVSVENQCQTGPLHPLLAILPVETNHEISEEAAGALVDEELAPGHNCCAVCADSAAGHLVSCKQCKKVAYCGDKHLEQDATRHSRNCLLLSHLAVFDNLSFTTQEQAASLELINFEPAALERVEGWSDVVTEACSSVFGAPNKASAKRRRGPASSGAAAASAGVSATVSTSPGNSADAGATPQAAALGTSAPQLDADFRLAARLAVASSYATYPLSTIYGMRASAAAVEAAGGPTAVAPPVDAEGAAGDEGAPLAQPPQPLVVCVLGASASAELAHLDVWKAVEGSGVSRPVVLQFVGPEVPDELHATTKALSDKLVATFWMGPYEELLDAAVLAAADRVIARHVPSGTPSHPVSTQRVTDELLLLPDLFVGFNMGLTCGDYEWQPTLDAIHKVLKRKVTAASGGAVRLPLLTTSNTHAEAVMEDELLTSAGWRAALAVQRNPLGSLETLQSGTFANDLYRKNAWVACYEVCGATPARQRRRVARGGASTPAGIAQRIGGWISQVASSLSPARLMRGTPAVSAVAAAAIGTPAPVSGRRGGRK